MKKRYCIAGASGRGYEMYAKSIIKDEFKDYAELAGIYDINIGRSRYVGEHTGVKVYEDFDVMLATEKPDAVIVTTMDSFHSHYAVRAMKAGFDVIVEKPMCITAEQAYEMLETEKQTGKHITVTHNMRYMPYIKAIKQLLYDKKIGDIYNVHFEWNLVYNGHGTSYFRRWHGVMANSGGLLLTKATHHFDTANWLIDSYPSKVFAFGAVNKYGNHGGFSGESCRTCNHKSECEFYHDFSGDKFVNEFYFANEKYDGYIYDGCVFRNNIDAYDTVNLNVLYQNGVTMSYTLNAVAAYEGWRMVINGSEGRMEIGKIATGDSMSNSDIITLYDMNGHKEVIEADTAVGVHGGGDIRLISDIIIGRDDDDILHQQATAIDGAAAVLLGAAGNESIRTGEVIELRAFLKKS